MGDFFFGKKFRIERRLTSTGSGLSYSSAEELLSLYYAISNGKDFTASAMCFLDN